MRAWKRSRIAPASGWELSTAASRPRTRSSMPSFEEHLDRIAAAARHALTAPEPWEGFLGYLSQVVGLQAADRGLSEILGAHLRTEHLLGRARTRIRPLVRQLIARAQDAGELRADVAYEDVSVLLWTTGRVVDATRDVEPEYLAALPCADGGRPPRWRRLPPATTATHRRQAQRCHAAVHETTSPASPSAPPFGGRPDIRKSGVRRPAPGRDPAHRRGCGAPLTREHRAPAGGVCHAVAPTDVLIPSAVLNITSA